MDPILSIVVPCYNSQSTIARLVNSLKCQTAKTGWTVTFVDDHSIDHTVDSILSQIKPSNPFSSADTRFNLCINPSKGAGSARNYGIKQSAGQYLWFIDSDDYLANDRVLELILNTLHANPNVDLFTINCMSVDRVGNKCAHSFTNLRAKPELYGKTMTDGFVQNFESLYSTIGFPPWNKIVRRKFLEDNHISFQNTLFCNDQYFSIRCMVEARSIYLIPSDFPLYCWLTAGRFHTSGSKLKKTHPEQYAIVLRGLKENCKWPNDDIRDKILADRAKRFGVKIP